MKSLRFVLSVVLLSLATGAFAQNHDMPKPAAAKSDAQISFDTIKTLAGTWEGSVTVDPPQPQMSDAKPLHDHDARDFPRKRARARDAGSRIRLWIRRSTTIRSPCSTWIAIALRLIHYCDAGNRPRMVARKSPDGKTIEFDFVDISGGTQYGHMHHAVFTAIDANHHTEDWTYMMPGDKPIRAHFDLQRTK